MQTLDIVRFTGVDLKPPIDIFRIAHCIQNLTGSVKYKSTVFRPRIKLNYHYTLRLHPAGSKTCQMY